MPLSFLLLVNPYTCLGGRRYIRHHCGLRLSSESSLVLIDPRIAKHLYWQNSEAETVLIHRRDLTQIREVQSTVIPQIKFTNHKQGAPGAAISEIIFERQPLIEVDGIGGPFSQLPCS